MDIVTPSICLSLLLTPSLFLQIALGANNPIALAEEGDQRSNMMMNIDKKKIGFPLCYYYLHVALMVFMNLHISRALLDTKDTYADRSQEDINSCLKVQERDEGTGIWWRRKAISSCSMAQYFM